MRCRAGPVCVGRIQVGWKSIVRAQLHRVRLEMVCLEEQLTRRADGRMLGREGATQQPCNFREKVPRACLIGFVLPPSDLTRHAGMFHPHQQHHLPPTSYMYLILSSLRHRLSPHDGPTCRNLQRNVDRAGQGSMSSRRLAAIHGEAWHKMNYLTYAFLRYLGRY